MDDCPDEQKQYVQKCFNKEMVKNDIWYVISNKWFTAWKLYVNYQDEGEESSGKPGDIDNSDLLNKNLELKEDFAIGNEIDVVPEEVWKYLSKIYGYQPNGSEKHLMRYVVQISPGEQRVEIYPLKLKLFSGKSNKGVVETLSETDTFGDLKKVMVKQFGLHNDETYKLSMKDEEEKWSIIDEKDDEPLAKLSLKSGQEIVIDSQTQNGQVYTRSSYNRESSSKGICGLSNLGNTCFMNSALQSMSNVPHLTHFFLETEWKKDINKGNPIGMKGDLACAFAQFIQSVWSGSMPVYSPRELKYNISRYAPQFSGYSQHDAHELLIFLLDGIHEDLNRVKKKPYIEFNDENDRPDESVAKETWEKYKMRNDSVIYDTFYGLLKSTVTCPDCKFISVTFDPFSTLSLPLPNDCEFYKKVTFYPEEWPLISALNLKVKLVKGGSMRYLSQSICTLLNRDGYKLKQEKIHSVRNGRVLSPDDYISIISDEDVALNVYEFDKHEKALVNVSMNFSDKHLSFQMVLPHEVDYNRLALCLKPFFNPQIWQLPTTTTSENGLLNGDAKMNENQTDSLILEELFEIKFREKNYSMERSIKRDTKNCITFYESSQLTLKSLIVKSDQLKSNVLSDIKQHESMKSNKSKVTLDDCFRLFTTEEKLGNRDLWYCRKCKEQKAAYKKFELWSLPDVVIIHLKRFYFRTFRREKINTEVYYPTRNLDLHSWAPHMSPDKCKYDLVAVSNHMGGMGGGHYTAYAKNKITDRWYLFDDSSTHEIDEARVVTPSAYLLVYIRKSSIDSEAMEVS